MRALILTVLFSMPSVAPAVAAIPVNVMAPLSIGDVRDPSSAASEPAWAEFRAQLRQAKRLGIHAVSTDVWWGVVEGQEPGSYDWRYYDRVSDEILAVGLRWVPILSFHQCGGNVGDTCDFPIPAWIWTRHIGKPGITDADSLKFRSEDGNVSSETISVWGTPTVLPDLSRFMRAFRDHFAPKASAISEVNVSLGPAGELRYPSYNSHDPGAGYPTRGRLQAYSALARASFREFMVKRIGPAGAGFEPPHRGRAPEAEDFFAAGMQHGEFGRAFFDFYADSLLDHGRLVLTEAVKVFGVEGGAFRGVDIGAKIPGVHWRSAIDRSAELAAGLVRTGRGDLADHDRGHGYQAIVGLFREIGRLPGAPKVVLHFTCLEMGNGDGSPAAGSMAKALVFWVAQEAHRQGVPIKGENALAGGIYDPRAWDNMLDAVTHGHYQGLTLLRLSDVVGSPAASERIPQLTGTPSR